MNIDDLGRDAARALIDAGRGAPIPPLDPKRSDRRRNVLAFAMSAAAVIVVVGVAALFGRILVDDPELDPADTTVVNTTQVITTTTPPVDMTTSTTVDPGVVVSPEFAANGWARSLVEISRSGDSSMVDVVTSRSLSRSVAIGSVGTGQPAAWAWADGSWQEILVEGSEAGGSLVDVDVNTEGFVAVGTLDGQPTVWRSSDGLAFAIDTNLPLPSSGVAFPAAVTAHADGLVVVGVGLEGESGAQEDDMDGVVWVESGDSWQVVQSPTFATAGFNANDPITELVDVTSGSAGLVAVGFQNEGPAAWLSPDGLTWERVDIPIDVRLTGVAQYEDRYFAWGTTGFRGSPTNDGMILTSTDGRDWQPVSGDFSGAGGSDGYQNVESVTFYADLGFYAVGSDHKEFTNIGAIAVWRSVDGLSWERVGHDDAVFGTFTEFGYGTANGVTIVDGDVLAVGVTGEAVPDGGSTRCCDLSAAGWIGRP